MATPIAEKRRPRPVLYINSALIGLQVLVAGAAFSDALGDDKAGLAILAVAALQAALTFYQQNVVTPLSDPRDAQGRSLVPNE